MNAEYTDFLAAKARTVHPAGHEPTKVHETLYDFQRDVVEWATRMGRAAVFAECGLGKTLIQLEWARQVHEHDGGDVLVLAPPAVAAQTVAEGEKIDLPATRCFDASDLRPGVNVTNYERLHLFEGAKFAGVVLDECFARGTHVATPTGSAAIETIRAGDKILSAAGADDVVGVRRREVSHAIRVTSGPDSCVSSPNHPFLTERGWKAAQDLEPGDRLVGSEEAMRLVRSSVRPEVEGEREAAFLRDVLLREMADEPPRPQSEGPQSRGRSEEGPIEERVVQGGQSRGQKGASPHRRAQPDGGSEDTGEGLGHAPSQGACAESAGGQRPADDRAATAAIGAPPARMGAGGICLARQEDGGIPNRVQARPWRPPSEDRNRSGRAHAPEPPRAGQEEGRQARRARVDGVEVLELGHPDLDRFRDADGKLRFYDLEVARHPSFSVNGWLVHNSSILKNYTGATRTALIERFEATPYKLACTATPAPNDHTELGNHAEFLGVMSRTEMLSMFFVHDGGSTQNWRLKGHARREFWEWVCSWAVVIRSPEDLGYDGSAFELPELRVSTDVVLRGVPSAGLLFTDAASMSLTERRAARKESCDERVARVSAMVNASAEPWVVWCDLNRESEALAAKIPDACEVTGSMPMDDKIEALEGFARGDYRVLVSKPSICGFGLNWQHASDMAFCGLSDSYEQFYQAVRRCWRFGQTRPVDVHVVISEAETVVAANVANKEKKAETMAEEVAGVTRASVRRNLKGSRMTKDKYETGIERGDAWTLHMGDCVETTAAMEPGTIDYSVFSPPFDSLYTYSASDRDMGNCARGGEFGEHFRFLVKQLFRVTKPGRNCSFHCMNLPTSKVRDGIIGLRDFRGEMIRLFVDEGWIFHSEVVIWKDPVTSMQRTKALGLLHKQLKKDSCMSRQGIPDYVVTMRKPGENPDPVENTNESFPVAEWQGYASPVWMDINASDTLQRTSAREEADERHICPLQLEVIRRCLRMWSREGDLVFSPFAGIGSEGYEAIKAGRRHVGIELKRSYFEQAVKNLRRAEIEAGQGSLFDAAAETEETPSTV